MINKHACKLLTHSKIFSPPLSPTLAKPHNQVSCLTNFSKLKFNHRFKSAFGKKACMPTFTMLRAIFTIFKPLIKLHDAVSSLTKFLELKLYHRFRCILDRQACTPTFVMFQAILTPFGPNPVETARRCFPFEQFLRI